MGRPPASQEPCSTKRIKECGGAREDAMHALWQTAIELGAHDVRGAHEGKWRAGEALRRMCCCSDQIWAGASRLAAPRFFIARRCAELLLQRADLGRRVLLLSSWARPQHHLSPIKNIVYSNPRPIDNKKQVPLPRIELGTPRLRSVCTTTVL